MKTQREEQVAQSFTASYHVAGLGQNPRQSRPLTTAPHSPTLRECLLGPHPACYTFHQLSPPTATPVPCGGWTVRVLARSCSHSL